MKKKSSNNWPFLICFILALSTFAVYYQVHNFQFVSYDDPVYIYKNPHVQTGITVETIKWAFTVGYAANWHPLTWLSLTLDRQLFGSNPTGFHLVNVFFHIANTLLVFLVLTSASSVGPKKMTGAIWQSAFVAALFALHPLHVESVAWVSERKDVLSTFFWLLTIAAYLRYVRKPGIRGYLLIMLVFALGLMAKPMLVTLPFVLLLLDYWPLARINRFNSQIIYRLVWEKVPFFALAAISSVITFFVQRSGQGVITLTMFPIKYRLLGAFVSYAEYIEKMFWPAKLAFFYPNPGQQVSIPYAVMSAIFLLVTTIIILLFAKNHRYLFTGWFWFIGTLVPVIGLVQVGSQAMADRYSYITLTGLFIIIAWGLPEILGKWQHRKNVLWVSSLVVLSALAVCTYRQTQYWKDSITLGDHALKVTENNYLAHFCMTEELMEQGRIDEAIKHNLEAIRINPDYIDAINSLGVALCGAKKIDEAVIWYKKALQIDPRAAATNANLGVIMARRGDFAQAVEYYKIATEKMDTPLIHRNFGYSLLNLGRLDEAVIEYRKALSAMPNDPGVLNELGYALAHAGKFDEAVSLYNKALQIAPDLVEIRLNLGFALTSSGKLEQAVKEYEEILRIQPQNAIAHNDFGVVLFQQKKLDQAIANFNRALQIDPNYTKAKNNLKAALAEKQKLQSPDNQKK